jgi:uncharacterized protein YjbI with pentapeptide repeats
MGIREPPMNRPTLVFVSYSHKDERFLTEFLDFLRGLEREGIGFWWDRKILGGELWDVAIKTKIRESDVALALVSQAFLDSPYCTDVEIQQVLAKKAVLMPLILGPCEWQRHEWLNSHQFLPRDGKTIEEHYQEPTERQNLFLQVRSQLREHAERLKAERWVLSSADRSGRSAPKMFEGDELKGQDRRGENFSGCEFRDCDLSGTSLARCDLRGARFFRAKALRQPLDLVEANLEGATVEGCRLPMVILTNAVLKGAQLVDSSFRGGRLTGCVFDDCTIEDLNIAKTQLDKASFRNAKIDRLTFQPVRYIPFLRGLRFLRTIKVPLQRRIDVTAVAPSQFTAFCLAERRKDDLFSKVAGLPAPLRIFRLALLAAYGIISDFGGSRARWFLSCGVALALFTLAHLCWPRGAEALVPAEVLIGLSLASAWPRSKVP